MKTAGICFKQSLLCAAVLLSLTFAAGAVAQVSSYGDGFCTMHLSRCPKEYDKTTLVVPLNVMAISANVKACGIQDSNTYFGGGAAPAIMFLIDHTMSMTRDKEGNPGADPRGNRFRVTKALIDTIYKKYPDAQIGVAVFGDGLVFNDDWDKNLVKFGGVTRQMSGVPNQSYLPIKPLNSPAERSGYAIANGAGANPKWLDVIQGMFNVPKNANDTATLRNGDTGEKAGELSGTNISIAFEAALEAFSVIDTAFTSPDKPFAPKRNRYIIFLSDGEPELYEGSSQQNCGEYPEIYSFSPRCLMQNNFMAGEMDVVRGGKTVKEKIPTTYTVFLSTTTTIRPPKLVTMTSNIQKNKYSESNTSSQIWVRTSDYTALFNHMMKYIVEPMLSMSTGTPKNIVVSSPGVTGSTGVMDGSFTFSRWLPTDTAVLTSVGMGITYDVQIIDTLKSSTGGDPTISVRTVDSLFNYEFRIRRSAGASNNWAAEQQLEETCASAPRLDLRYQKTSSSPSDTSGESLVGKDVKGNMDSLLIVFDNTGGLFQYDKVVVQVLNADGIVSDLESFTLVKSSDGLWRYKFPREVKASASKGDGKLQHTGQDSIIVVFRNPDIPLDTVRVAVPYVSNAMSFYDREGDPAYGEMLPNEMTLEAGRQLDIYVKLFDSNNKWSQEMTSDVGKITWAVTVNQAVVDQNVLVRDGAHAIFRTVTIGDAYVVTATYRDGALVINKQMTIKVVPGPAKYLEVVTDSAAIVSGRVSDVAYLSGTKSFTFRKDSSQAVFYAVLRDAYGNYIGVAAGADWKSTHTESITAEARGDSSSALVSKHGSNFGDDLYVTVTKTVKRDGAPDTTLSDRVHIAVVGESYSAVGPNPFVPGHSPIMERLKTLVTNQEALALYEPIVAYSGSGAGKGNANNADGVLVTATAPRPVKVGGVVANGVKYVMDTKAVIYDAVGRVVFRSRPGDIVTTDGNTFGFVWDGKNMKGKTVGWGTYAMQITATMTNGEKFVVTRMIGVRFDGTWTKW